MAGADEVRYDDQCRRARGGRTPEGPLLRQRCHAAHQALPTHGVECGQQLIACHVAFAFEQCGELGPEVLLPGLDHRSLRFQLYIEVADRAQNSGEPPELAPKVTDAYRKHVDEEIECGA